MREFLHVDDLADALVYLAQTYSDEEFVNIGTGDEVSIADLARLVQDAVGFRGELVFDASRPDGTPRKLVDTTKLNSLGWHPSVPLAHGIPAVYRWFLDHHTTGAAHSAAA